MSLRWYIAQLRRAFVAPESILRHSMPKPRVWDGPTYPPVITTEDVTPPFEPPPPEKGPNECARSACKNAVTWPQYWCSDACVHAWHREHWRLTA